MLAIVLLQVESRFQTLAPTRFRKHEAIPAQPFAEWQEHAAQNFAPRLIHQNKRREAHARQPGPTPTEQLGRTTAGCNT